ncbi:unnamed protein product [Prunus armeniaca]
MLRDGNRMVQTLMTCWLGRRSVDVKSSRYEATTSLAKDVFPLRKKPRIPSIEKTQVGAVPHHQLGLNISFVQIARRLAVGAIFVMFHSSLMQTSSEIMIYSVKWFVDELVHLLRGKEVLIFLSVVQVVYTSERMEIELGRLLIYPIIKV